MVDDDTIAVFQRDGVVCIRGLFDPEWVRLLRQECDRDMATPSEMSKDINAEDSTGLFFFDTFLFHHPSLRGFRHAALNGPGAEAAGGLMVSSQARLVFDQLLVKEPGTSTETLWHHDITYWPVIGTVVTVWVALDHVSTETGAVEYLKGSHRWGQEYRPISFNPNEQYGEDLPPMPDIEARRSEYDIVSYDLAPGDVTVHHGLTLHHAPGNRSTNVRRRAYIQRWAGDGVVYQPRQKAMAIKHDPQLPLPVPGTALSGKLFPLCWQQAGVACPRL